MTYKEFIGPISASYKYINSSGHAEVYQYCENGEWSIPRYILMIDHQGYKSDLISSYELMTRALQTINFIEDKMTKKDYYPVSNPTSFVRDF